MRVSKRLFKKPLKGWVQSDWDFTKCGWTPKEADRIVKHMQAERNFWMTLSKIPNSNELMRRQLDFSLCFVTARFATDGLPVEYQASEWLYNNFALKDAFVISSRKKGQNALELGADFAIEDKIENIQDILRTAPDCKVAIMDQPYNKNFQHSKVIRVGSVNEWVKSIK